MIKNPLLYTIDNKLFKKVLRRLDDTKHTCIFAIPNDQLYRKSREQLKMIPLVDNLEGKELIQFRHSRHILIYHHPYYLIVPIFEYFVFKNGNVNQYLNTLEIKMHKSRTTKTGDVPMFNISFITNRSTIQTFDAVVIKLNTD